MEATKSADGSSPEATKSLAGSSNSLQWLDILEKDFDRAFIEVDILMGDVDADQADLALECRQKMTGISSCFAQLVCKSQTLFHKNNRLEEEIADYKNQLAAANAARALAEKQTHDLTCRLFARTAPHESDMLRKKIDQAIQEFRDQYLPNEKAEAHAAVLSSENHKLRQVINAMQSEVYAARLAAKYLDKELAGRIQQIQLLGRDMRGAEHDRLWNQLEAEIHLHRHKTGAFTRPRELPSSICLVIRACRGRLKSGGGEKNSENGSVKSRGKGGESVRMVTLKKAENEGLGLSVTGGREHGVPILISEIHPGQPAERCGELRVGDTILSVNGINLRNTKTESSSFEVVFVSPDPDSDDDRSVLLETDDGSTFNLYEEQMVDGPVEANANSNTCSSRSSTASDHSKANKTEEADTKQTEVVEKAD
ncbi:PDZ domain-containing protein [Aphelenchoides fujianensis]|nr:PDZ domain-containing protein [Aphelenchoides fujianensis]